MTFVKRPRLAWGLAVTLVCVAAAVALAATRLGPHLRTEVIRALESRMDAAVDLQAFDVTLLPSPRVTGGGLTIRHRTRTDLPPLIVVHHFSGTVGWLGLLRAQLDAASLDGLEITIPPRRAADMPAVRATEASSHDDDAEPTWFRIGTVTAANARLTILPRDPNKDPRVFDIFALDMREVTLLEPSRFTASLTNPIPAGRIETSGSVGPWSAGEPSQTPVEGQFQFTADLGTIKGIAGQLASEGTYGGIIERIVTSGTTHVPDFRIPRLNAAARPLRTTFEAVVDGTSGDVQLASVQADLGDSRFLAKGFVVGTKGIKGKRVLLDVASAGARMEDVLALTIAAQPPMMSGSLRLETALDLPQGDADVIDKLRLAGRATISNARFTRDGVQDKVDNLSRRAQGKPEDGDIEDVPSTIQTTFSMADGVLRLAEVRYTVEGAAVQLQGTYALSSGALDFAGTVRLEASASDTQTGWRHFMLKPFDWMFRKGGAGTRLAIRVSGTAEDPTFGLDMGRTLQGK